MIILSAKDICKSYGTDVILDGISFHVNKGDRIGIVGPNGAGKSTLLKILTGEMSKDSGDIFMAADTQIGYLRQIDNFHSDKTVIEEVNSIFEQFYKMERDMERMSQRISEIGENQDNEEELNKLLENYDRVQHEYGEKGGYSYKSEIRGMLTSMAFPEEYYNKQIDMLSGGERTRLALCCMLLKKPDLLFLDEPTNHLDIGTLKWLEQYLKSYDGTFIIVSHDRYFLNQTVKRVFEVHNHKMDIYEGNYTQFAQKKKQKREDELRKYNAQQKEIAKQEELIRRFKENGTEKLAKRAKSREKKLDRMEIIDRPESEKGKMKIHFKENFQSGKDVVYAEDLAKSFGYGPNKNHLFKNVNLDIKRGEKICILGPNGVGKTTLLKMLLGQMEPTDGYIKIGTNVEIGYYDQGQRLLNDSLSVLEEVHETYRLYTQQEIRSFLGRFMFKDDMIYVPVGGLSGGEKARLSLLKLMMSGSNLLIMDEPTNHLDIDSKEVFEDALLDFPGTAIIVSHDRYFLSKVPDRILELKPDGVTNYLGKYDYYQEKKNQIESGKKYLENLKADSLGQFTALDLSSQNGTKCKKNGVEDSSSIQSGPKLEDMLAKINDESSIIEDEKIFEEARALLSSQEERRLKKELETKRRRLEKEKQKLEEEIEIMEEESSNLEEKMCSPDIVSDHGKLAELSIKLNDLKDELQKKYEKWLQYEEV